MTTMLEQRAAAASAVRSVTPTAAQLKARALAIKTELPVLVADRGALSIAYLAGDPEAIKASDEIDAKRVKLLAELEHIEVAIPEVSQREHSQVPVISPRDAERVKREICAIITERREQFLWQLHSGHSNTGQQKMFNATLGKHVSMRPREIEDQLNYVDPVTIACERLQPLVKQVILTITRDDAPDAVEDAHKRAKAERDEKIDKLARDLVGQTKLPPTPPDIAKLLGE